MCFSLNFACKAILFYSWKVFITQSLGDDITCSAGSLLQSLVDNFCELFISEIIHHSMHFFFFKTIPLLLNFTVLVFLDLFLFFHSWNILENG